MKNKFQICVLIAILIKFNFAIAQNWKLLGNTGTSTSTDFVGTTDPTPLQFGTNNSFPQMYLNTNGRFGINTTTPFELLDVNGNIHLPQTGTINLNGSNQVFIANPITSNILIGIGAGISITGATSCVFVGEDAGNSNTGSGGNTYMGWRSGRLAVGSENTYIGNRTGEGGGTFNGAQNTFIGVSAGQQSTTGSYNCFMGVASGFNNIGQMNVFLGNGSGFSNLDGQENSFIGYNSGFSNTNEDHNVFVGALSGEHATANNNVFVGYSAGQVTTANSNVFVGYVSGINNGIGAQNSFFGASSGNTNTVGIDNTFIGCKAGFSNLNANGNTFLGSESGLTNTSGINNFFGGFRSGFSNDRGNNNVFLGYKAGYTNVDAEYNSFIGGESGFSNISGTKNAFVGYHSGYSNNTGNENVFSGYNAAYSNRSGKENTIIGTEAGYTGDKDGNTFVGYKSGRAFNTGTHNVYIGHSAGSLPASATNNTLVGYNTTHTSGLSNATALGYNANVVHDDNMILGANNVNVGIGLSGVTGGPTTKLQIDGISSQLRLSYTYNTIYSDFFTNSSGDLQINTKNSGADRQVGINNGTGTLTRTLDINGNMRLRTLPNAGFNVNGNATINRFLVADPATGEIFWRDDIGTGILGNCGTGGTNNFISKYSGTATVCTSGIWENATSDHNVGMGTTTPSYFLSHFGNALFASIGDVDAYLYGTFNTQHNIPLSVKTNDYEEGLFIFSSEIPCNGACANETDRLNLFADSNGDLFYDSRAPFTFFRERIYNEDMLGFAPDYHTTVIVDDFSSNPAGVTSLFTGAFGVPRLYVEGSSKSTANNGTINDYAVWGNNINDNANGHYITGLRGTATVPCAGGCSGSITHKRGGLFWAANSTDTRSECYAVEALAWQADGTNVYLAGGVFNAGDPFNADPDKQVVSGRENYGVIGRAKCTTNGVNYGGYFDAANGVNSFGGHFTAVNGVNNYGIYASAPVISIQCPTGGPCTEAAGYFNGDVFTTSSYVVSDSSLKSNISLLQNNNNLLNNIQAYSYTFNTSNTALNLPNGTHYGFMAQQVEQNFPNMVKEFVQPGEYDSLGNTIKPETRFKAVNNIEFIPMLWQGYQQQQQKLDSIINVINNLQQIIDACCNNGGGTRSVNPSTLELENLATLQLLQNDPNPWSESTWVRWNISKEFTTANIYFYDNSGAQINQYKITGTGKGELQVFGSKLSNGIYTYTLVVDGKIIDSKKMMKAQ